VISDVQYSFVLSIKSARIRKPLNTIKVWMMSLWLVVDWAGHWSFSVVVWGYTTQLCSMHSALAAAPYTSGGYQHPDRCGLECRSREVITTTTRQRYFLRHCTPGTWCSWRRLERTWRYIDHDLYKISGHKGFVLSSKGCKHLSDGETSSLEGKGTVSCWDGFQAGCFESVLEL
jgi:hypothetical protein